MQLSKSDIHVRHIMSKQLKLVLKGFSYTRNEREGACLLQNNQTNPNIHVKLGHTLEIWI